MTTDKPAPDANSVIKRMMIIIALLNVAEGLGQSGGIYSQPLTLVCKALFGWAPDQVTRFIAVLIIPWIIKPVYGAISDFVPIFGYRRRPWLIISNLLAVGGCLWMSRLTTSNSILAALSVISVGLAASSTIFEAVLVEIGNKLGRAGEFLNVQWLWFNIAAVVALLGGGWLAEHYAPTAAFHTAAIIAAIVPGIVAVATWFLVTEDKTKFQPMYGTWSDVKAIFGDRRLWIVAAFLFMWNIVPSFGTPLFYHMVDNLKFSQQFIGLLGAIGAGGAVAGSFIYGWLAHRMKLKTILYLSVALCVVGNLAFVFMTGPVSAIAINIINGATSMIALVATLAVAAHATPDKTAALTYALLMSVNNLAGQLSTNIGSWLYVHTFNNHLNPVIYVAGAAALLPLILIPFLKLGGEGGNTLLGKLAPPAMLKKIRYAKRSAALTSGF